MKFIAAIFLFVAIYFVLSQIFGITTPLVVSYVVVGLSASIFMVSVTLAANTGSSVVGKLEGRIRIDSIRASPWKLFQMTIAIFHDAIAYLVYWPVLLLVDDASLIWATVRGRTNEASLPLLRQELGAIGLVLQSATILVCTCLVLLYVYLAPDALHGTSFLQLFIYGSVVSTFLSLVWISLVPPEAVMRRALSPAETYRAFVALLFIAFLNGAIAVNLLRAVSGAELRGAVELFGDLVSFGYTDPDVLRLLSDLKPSLSVESLTEASSKLVDLQSYTWLMLAVSGLTGLTITGRGLGLVVLDSNSFTRTEGETLAIVSLCLKSREPVRARLHSVSLRQNHHVHTMIELYNHLDRREFDAAWNLVHTFVRRRRNDVLHLDSDISLSDSERVFTVVDLLGSWGRPELLLEFSVWGIEKGFVEEEEITQVVFAAIAEGFDEWYAFSHYLQALLKFGNNSSPAAKIVSSLLRVPDGVQGSLEPPRSVKEVMRFVVKDGTKRMLMQRITASRVYRYTSKQIDMLALREVMPSGAVELRDLDWPALLNQVPDAKKLICFVSLYPLLRALSDYDKNDVPKSMTEGLAILETWPVESCSRLGLPVEQFRTTMATALQMAGAKSA
ncbi:MAG: hypothetical protein NW217_12170 [Hyphomicrobiaceae bacterium]|nr:hypothetical protein [Hyphomicrobiaceae bacterium]